MTMCAGFTGQCAAPGGGWIKKRSEATSSFGGDSRESEAYMRQGDLGWRRGKDTEVPICSLQLLCALVRVKGPNVRVNLPNTRPLIFRAWRCMLYLIAQLISGM